MGFWQYFEGRIESKSNSRSNAKKGVLQWLAGNDEGCILKWSIQGSLYAQNQAEVCV